uniref:uncharacterized protein LOC122590082 n=1 Tax=Erigeron canadensis TaxID=72917 RepID=UPI001CB98904|nr:uncharacterized protein LOC122590082 [Erigeron canadensis]
MERKMVVSCAIVAVLGIISAATGFAGEATRIKDSDVYLEDGLCVYPSSPALALGFIAGVFAIITRIYISLTFGGSNCCHRDDPNSALVSKSLYALSWIASVAAVVLLLAAATLNDKEEGGEVDSYGYSTSCYVVKPGIFAAGAVLALFSAVFGIAGYVLAFTKTTTNNPHNIDLSMADTTTITNEDDLEKSPLSCTPPSATLSTNSK